MWEEKNKNIGKDVRNRKAIVRMSKKDEDVYYLNYNRDRKAKEKENKEERNGL